MLTQISPGLRRFNIVSNSLAGGVSDATEEFSWAPEMSLSKIISKPGMFLQKPKCTISLEQLQGSANTHCSWHFNKQVDMINSDMQFINFESMLVSCLPDEKLTIHPDSIKLHRVSSILALPNKVESILAEGVFKTFQIHFLSPRSARGDKAHANFNVYFEEPSIQALPNIQTKELNLMEGRIPPMFENMGIQRQM